MLLSVQSQNSQSYSGNTVTTVTSEMSYAFVYIQMFHHIFCNLPNLYLTAKNSQIQVRKNSSNLLKKKKGGQDKISEGNSLEQNQSWKLYLTSSGNSMTRLLLGFCAAMSNKKQSIKKVVKGLCSFLASESCPKLVWACYLASRFHKELQAVLQKTRGSGHVCSKMARFSEKPDHI